jgi:hypothetical protein
MKSKETFSEKLRRWTKEAVTQSDKDWYSQQADLWDQHYK